MFSPGTCVCGFWLMTKVWLPPHNSCFTEIIVSVKGFKNLEAQRVRLAPEPTNASPLCTWKPCKKTQVKEKSKHRHSIAFLEPKEFPYGPFFRWCKQTQEPYWKLMRKLKKLRMVQSFRVSSLRLRCFTSITATILNKTSVLVYHYITIWL